MEKKEIIADLIKNGAEPVKNLKVKNVTVTPFDTYIRLSLTLDKDVKGMISKDEGVTYEEGETKIIFVSLYGILSLLKDNDDVAFAVNQLSKNPDAMSVVLSRATIDILQHKIAKGDTYVNPWSTDGTETVFDHDTIINYVTDIKLSDFALRKIDKLADAMLGF